jgi:hypothetical protein
VIGYEQGDLLAQEAMQAAEDHADEGWLRAARQEIAALAASGEPWTTDHVWYRLEQLGVTTREPRALGALIRKAARDGLIRQQGYTPTTRPEAHARPIPVWCGRRVA